MIVWPDLCLHRLLRIFHRLLGIFRGGLQRVSCIFRGVYCFVDFFFSRFESLCLRLSIKVVPEDCGQWIAFAKSWFVHNQPYVFLFETNLMIGQLRESQPCTVFSIWVTIPRNWQKWFFQNLGAKSVEHLYKSLVALPAHLSACAPLLPCSRRQLACSRNPEANISIPHKLYRKEGLYDLNSTLEIVAGLPCVEVRFSILASLHCCLVVLVGSAREEGEYWSLMFRIFNLSRQSVCSLVTLGHSELGWAQRWLGRTRKKKTLIRLCTIVTNSLSRLSGLWCSRGTLQQNPFR